MFSDPLSGQTRDILLCSIWWFPCCKFANPGWFQAPMWYHWMQCWEEIITIMMKYYLCLQHTTRYHPKSRRINFFFFRKEKFSQKPLNSLMSHWSGLHLMPIPKHITTTMIDHDCWRRLILIHSWKQFYLVLTKFYPFKFKVSNKMKMLSINIL